MNSTPLFNPVNPELSLNFLPAYWHWLLTPCLSLLADDCQLSIIATKQATPLLLTGFHYQLIHLSQSPKNFDHLFNSHAFTQPLSGINFQQMSLIRPYLANFNQAFFSNNTSFWIILGIVAARTRISPQRLQPLANWLAFLSIYTTVQCLSLTHTTVTTFMQWLPSSLPNKSLIDSVMLETIFSIHTTYFDLTAYVPSTLSQHNAAKSAQNDFLTDYQSILQDYQQCQPLGIVSLMPNKNNHRLHAAKIIPLSYAKNMADSDTVTADPTNLGLPFTSVLQRHWMSFATVLTAFVIGGIGALITVYKTPTVTASPSNKMLSDLPHDVAIIRTDTPPAKTPTKSLKSPIHSNASKTDDQQKASLTKTVMNKAKAGKAQTHLSKALASQNDKKSKITDTSNKPMHKTVLKKSTVSHNTKTD